jgi:hypothetical protein
MANTRPCLFEHCKIANLQKNPGSVVGGIENEEPKNKGLALARSESLPVL